MLVHQMALQPRAKSGDANGLHHMPVEVISLIARQMLDRAQPVARLANASRGLRAALTDGAGRLRVGSVVTSRLYCIGRAVARVSLTELEVLRIDLSAESRECLHRQEIERSICELSRSLEQASALRVLSVRLASFDVSMERVRLNREAWEALIRGIAALGDHKRITTLDLSAFSIKESQATQAVSLPAGAGPELPGTPAAAARQRHEAGLTADQAETATRMAVLAVASPARSRVLRRAATSPTRGGCKKAVAAQPELTTFLGALGRLSTLEELSLTHDEIFGCTAQLLPPVFQSMRCLRKVDLTRNHIPKQVMHALRDALPPGIKLHGDDQQTFFFY
mmetsp:Transcript_24724/g.54622  ORF Transcript_24724/g.54622 Transcript_24724/m.54622 type:complete len:338 (+) Transcript_24724:25-1038(+)